MSTFKERQIIFAELAQHTNTAFSLADAALDEITRLRAELENEKARGIHSCHPNCTFSGCVNKKLRADLARLSDQLGINV